jgi:hypothetical protein
MMIKVGRFKMSLTAIELSDKFSDKELRRALKKIKKKRWLQAWAI